MKNRGDRLNADRCVPFNDDSLTLIPGTKSVDSCWLIPVTVVLAGINDVVELVVQ